MRWTVLATVAALFALTHVVLERVATYAEVHLGAFLWKQQDTLQLLSPHNYVNRGRGRLWIYGPSEAREALLLEEIESRVQGLSPYQNSQQEGTFEEGLIVLNYIERVYGPSAIPDAVLFGITARFVANIRPQPSPLFTAIDRYSPSVTLDDRERPPRLVERAWLEGVRARMALLALQPDRYRRGAFALASRGVTHVAPALAADRRVWGPVTHAKRLNARIASEAAITRWLGKSGNQHEKIRMWDPREDRAAIARDFQVLRDFTTRHGIDLYVVNLPEPSWNRARYDANKYHAYLRFVREELGAAPFLDLRTALPDEEFYDWTHVTWEGGRHVSRLVASFIQDQRAVERESRAGVTAAGARAENVSPVYREIE